MPAQRRPLTIPLATRDATAAKDGRLTNCYTEEGVGGMMTCKRPGFSVQAATGAGCAQGSITFNGGALFIKNDNIVINLEPVSNGASWTALTAPPKPTQDDIAGTTKPGYMVSHGGVLYHIGGKNNVDTDISIYQSSDNGASWTTILTTAPFAGSLLLISQAAVSFNGRIYVLLNTNAVWSSADGVSWTNHTSDLSGGGTRLAQGLIVHNNLLYAFLGSTSASMTVWSSPNGSTWTAVNGGIAGLGSRTRSAFYSLAGALYIAAGLSGTLTITNDVWTSVDNGTTWTQATAAAAFSARQYPMGLVYDDFLWLLGGATNLGATSVDDDVYRSTDGASWSSMTGAAGWTARYGASCCVHNGLMYIGPGLGFSGGSTLARSSLHKSTPGTATNVTLSSATQSCLPMQVALIPVNGSEPTKAFIKSTKDAWVYDGTTATKVTDSDYPDDTVYGTAYLDGGIYVMDTKGVVFGSDLLAPLSWNALNFISANAEADAGVALARQLDNIIAFKETSIEIFYDAGNPTGSPLAKMSQALLEVGCASAFSIAYSDNTLFFMSQHKQRGRSIMKFEGITPSVVSTPNIDRILDGDDLATIYAFVVRLRGHVFYFLTLKTSAITLVFDDTGKAWFFATKLSALSPASVSSIAVQSDGSILVTMPLAHGASDGDHVVIANATPSDANGSFNLRYDTSVHAATQFSYVPDSTVSGSITGSVTATFYTSSYFPGAYYARGTNVDLVLDESTGDVYRLDATLYQDNGNPIDMHVRTEREDFGTINPKTYNSLALIGDNVSSKCAIRYCDDDYSTFSKYRLADLSKKRPRLTQLGSAERRAWEIRHTMNTDCRLSHAEPDIQGWRG